MYSSLEDASPSGTVVIRGQHDESDSPRTPKSRLGMQERTSSASAEDSATNLAEVSFVINSFFNFQQRVDLSLYIIVECCLIFPCTEL